MCYFFLSGVKEVISMPSKTQIIQAVLDVLTAIGMALLALFK